MLTHNRMRHHLGELPTWHFDVGEPVYLDSKVVHLFSPLSSSAHWFLIQKDDSNPIYLRWFGLCQLFPGSGELGWVSEDELFSITDRGFPYVKFDRRWSGTLENAYIALEMPVPQWIEATDPEKD